MTPSLKLHADGFPAADEDGGRDLEPIELGAGQFDAALRGVRHAVRIMSDLQAWAATTAGGSEGEKQRIWASEREFETVVEELRRAKAEADLFRRRVAVAEGRLELVMAAIARMVTTLPSKDAMAGGEA
jgi:hypothetical protein